jgi:hypothetical protein
MPNYLAPTSPSRVSNAASMFCEAAGPRSSDILRHRLRTPASGPELMAGSTTAITTRFVRRCGSHSREIGELINLRGVYGKSQMLRFDSTGASALAGADLLDQASDGRHDALFAGSSPRCTASCQQLLAPRRRGQRTP